MSWTTYVKEDPVQGVIIAAWALLVIAVFLQTVSLLVVVLR